jgi:hypothetical protein
MKALGILRRAVSEPYPAPPKPPLSFELSVVERLPTSDQFRTMQRYYGRPISAFLSAHPSTSGSEGGTGKDEVERVIQTAKANPMALKYPIVVDWDAGKIAVGSVNDVEGLLQARARLRDEDGEGGGGKTGGEQKKGLLSSLFGSS